MKTLRIIGAIVAVVLATGLTSCNEDDDTPEGTVITNFATLEALSEDGTSFSVIYDTKSSPVYYTAPQRVNSDDVKVGERLLVNFRVPITSSAQEGGNVQLIAYQPVINGTIEWKTKEELSKMISSTLQMQSMWITGSYLNMDMIALYQNKPKTFAIYGDESTKNDKKPMLYLIFLTDSEVVSNWRNLYASINVGSVWNNPNYDGFYLSYSDNTTTGAKVVEFTSKDTIKPVD